VVIEERRKRVLSDGTTDGSSYTVHRYIRGRLLGKGGFAKVYLCTAVDTNKHYAVKVVPKANLVKARARQKVRKFA
jgi:serine/threonine protein kinase